MSEAIKRCMICAKPAEFLTGGICQPCQDRIRREALGEQAGVAEGAEREITRHGIAPKK
jgi:hypothetical protein